MTEVGKVRIERAHDQKCPSFAVSARKILESLETHMKRKPVKKPWYNHPKLLNTHTHTHKSSTKGKTNKCIKCVKMAGELYLCL